MVNWVFNHLNRPSAGAAVVSIIWDDSFYLQQNGHSKTFPGAQRAEKRQRRCQKDKPTASHDCQ